MPLQEQIANLAPLVALRQQIADREKIPERLAHLFALDEQVCAMDPVLHKRPACRLQACALALRDLVLMMRKGQVLAPHVQIETRPENLHAHRAALDVPSRTAFSPWTRPKYITILRHPRLPQREIRERLFVVLI